MNRQSFLAVFAVPVLILASCSGKYDFVQKPVEGEGARGGLLTLGVGENGGSLNVQSLGDTYSEIVFTADEKWEVRGPEGYEDWIELEKVSGADLGSVGTSTIRVTVRPNLSGDSRSANLEFIGENTRKALATLTVSQDAIIFRLSDDTQTQLEDNRVNMSFKWSEFILKDGEERSKDQPFARSFTLESNVEYEIEGQEDAEKVFDFHITGEGQARTITIVPKEPCMADAGIDMTLRVKPKISMTLRPNELEDVNNRAIPLRLFQDHRLFKVQWDNTDDVVFSELGYNKNGDHAEFSVLTNPGDSLTVRYDNRLSLRRSVSQLEQDETIINTEGTLSVDVCAPFANPDRESARLFDIIVSPRLPREVKEYYKDNLDRFNDTLKCAQKRLVFDFVGEKMDPNPWYGKDFENEDVGHEENHQEYNVQLTTSAPLEEFCDYPVDHEWIGLSPGTPKVNKDNTYTYELSFTLTKQNLDTGNYLSTPSKGKNYQTSGYAYFGSRAVSEGKPYLIKPKESLFAEGQAPEGEMFVFSQKPFEFGLVDGWPEGLGRLPAVSTGRRHPVRFKSSGQWEIRYSDKNQDWVVEENDLDKGTHPKGYSYELNFGSGSSNAKDKDRNVDLYFVSLNHKNAGETFDDGKYEIGPFEIRQKKFVFEIRNSIEEGSGIKDNLGEVPAYQPEDSEPIGFYLECGCHWTMVYPSFLKPSKVQSQDEEDFGIQLTFGVVPNTTFTPKPEDKIVITADLGNGVKDTKEVKVSQAAFVFDEPKLLWSTIEPYYEDEQSFGTFRLTKGVKWNVFNGDEPMLAEDKTATGDDEPLAFKPKTNLSGEPVSVQYVIRVTEPKAVENTEVESRNVDFRQKGFVFSIDNERQIDFKELSGLTVTRTLVSSGPWEVSSTTDWLHSKETSGGITPGLPLELSADPNTDLKPRDGKIVFRSVAHQQAGKTREIELSVTQERFEWSVTPVSGSLDQGWTFDPVEGTKEILLDVVSSGQWKFKNLPSWISASPDGDNGDESGAKKRVKLIVDNNLELEPRSTEGLSLVSTVTGANDCIQPISVNQNEFVWVFENLPLRGGDDDNKDDGILTWDSAIDHAVKKFTVKSSGPWEIRGNNHKPLTSLGEWTISDMSSEGSPKGLSVSINPPLNSERAQRRIAFYIESRLHDGKSVPGYHSQMIIAEQPAFLLQIGTYYDNKPYECTPLKPWNDKDLSPDTGSQDMPQEIKLEGIQCTPGTEWQITVKPKDTWIKVDKFDCKEGTATLKVDNHTGSVKREATLSLESTYEGIDASQDIHVVQSGFVFTATPSKVDDLTSQGGAREVTVNCSAEWGVESWSNHEMVTDAHRDGKILKIEVSSYSGDVPRSCRITINSHGRTVDIDVSQGNFKFDVMDSVTNSELPSSITLSPRKGDSRVNVSLTSNVNWKIENRCSEWLETTPISHGDLQEPTDTNNGITYNFTVKARDDNQTSTPHEGDLVLWNGVEPKTYRFIQDGFRTGEESLAEFNAYRQDPSTEVRKATVMSSVEWYVDIPDSYKNWLHVEPLRGDGGQDQDLSVWVDNNNDESPRNGGYFEIKDNAGYGLSRKVKVSQKAFEWEVVERDLHVSPTAINFEALNPGEGVCNVTSSAPVTVAITGNDASYFTVSAKPEGELTVLTVSPVGNNTEMIRREATLVIEARDAGKRKEIALSQDAFEFKVTYDNKPVENGKKIYYGPGGGNNGFQINSSGKWHLKDVPQWLNSPNTSGNGGTIENVVFQSSKHAKGELQQATITVVCEDNPDLNISTIHIQDVFGVEGSLTEFGPMDNTPQYFTVYASKDFSISAPNWVTIEPYTTQGSAKKLKVSVEPNVTRVQRGENNNVVVNYIPEGYSEPSTIKLTVKQSGYLWDETSVSHTFPAAPTAEEGEWTFNVVASGGWSVKDQVGDWFEVLPPSGSGSGSVTVKVKSNNAGDQRTGSFSIVADDNTNLKKEVALTQSKLKFDVSPNSLEFAAVSPTDKTITVDAECDWNWTWGQGDQDWLTVTPNGNTLSVKPKADNQSDKNNSVEVIVYSTAISEISHTVTVTQDYYYLDVDKSELSFDVNPDAQQTFNISCSGSWTISGVPDWLSGIPSEGSGDQEITVTASQNKGPRREATITVTSKDYPGVSKSVVVYQAASQYTQPEAVDLGLSVKWATFNLGASAPEEPGFYFAWGEVIPKESYVEENYTKPSDKDGYLSLTDDAANVNLGNGWRMPTEEEFGKLISECTWTWKTINGKSGYEVSRNNKTIFLPVTGYCNNGMTYINTVGYYWSSYSKERTNARILNFGSTFHEVNSFDRYYGIAIRPVQDK